MKKIVFLILAVLFVAAPGIQAAEVKNLVNGQRGSQAFARYDLAGRVGEKEAEVAVFIEVGGERYPADKLSLKGAFGPKVKVGGGKEIVWDVLSDLPGGYGGDIVWDVEVSGGGAFSDPATGMQFVGVKGGCFSREGNQACVSDFSIGKFEVTQGQWRKLMGNNPSHFGSCGDDCPVETVSWDDAQQFIGKLKTQTGKNYRLPTEAEWEYACRSGGKNEEYCGGNNIDAVAWYVKNSGATTHRVGTKQPNGLGIHDMSGNVWEWVSDWHSAYPSGQVQDYSGPPSGSSRVNRGGSWFGDAGIARAAFRVGFLPGLRNGYLGFRLASPVQ